MFWPRSTGKKYFHQKGKICPRRGTHKMTLATGKYPNTLFNYKYGMHTANSKKTWTIRFINILLKNNIILYNLAHNLVGWKLNINIIVWNWLLLCTPNWGYLSNEGQTILLTLMILAFQCLWHKILQEEKSRLCNKKTYNNSIHTVVCY